VSKYGLVSYSALDIASRDLVEDQSEVAMRSGPISNFRGVVRYFWLSTESPEALWNG